MLIYHFNAVDLTYKPKSIGVVKLIVRAFIETILFVLFTCNKSNLQTKSMSAVKLICSGRTTSVLFFIEKLNGGSY